VYLRQGDDFVAMRDEPYETEAVLQELLAEHPELLTGDGDAAAGAGWLFVRREVPLFDEDERLSAGWLDHLFLDREGIPTLVEVKRGSDARIRREVVGQLLDYAANASACWSADQLRGWFETSCEDPGATLATMLGAVEDPGEFWGRVETNLAAGRLRLVFVADEIPAGLRRIVEFLSLQMHQTEVIAVDVKQYVARDGQVRTFVPRVHGRTERKVGERRTWTRGSILRELRDRHDDAIAKAAEAIFDWAGRRGLRFWFGAGQKDGSFQAGVDEGLQYLWPFTLYTYGRVEINFQYMARRAPFDDLAKRAELRRRLGQIDGVQLSDHDDMRPSIPLAMLTSQEALSCFLDALEWAFEQAGVRFGD
jgi:hypothetical protein